MQNLLEIEQAWQLIKEAIQTNPVDTIPLEAAVGRTVARTVVADIDSPPFSKSLVDGLAIADWQGPGQVYQVVETITAGQVPTRLLERDQATRIMTGSPIPEGTRGVVMVEETEEIETGRVRVQAEQFRDGQNILPQGRVIREGEPLVASGRMLRPHDIGALAEFGLTRLPIYRPSAVSILTTGDELVPPDQQPGPGQIRNSNGALLLALARSTGAVVTDLGIGRDSRESLLPKIEAGLQGNVLVIAGGVSAGTKDLIPQCLAESNVEQVFHKINLKPGKPLWFGRSATGCLVFGLPGNPVSSLVCFRLFAEPAIRRQSHPQSQGLEWEMGELIEDFKIRGGRRTFWPVRVSRSLESLDNAKAASWPRLSPLPWKGSSDQVTFLQADALMDGGAGTDKLAAGTRVRFIGLRGGFPVPERDGY